MRTLLSLLLCATSLIGQDWTATDQAAMQAWQQGGVVEEPSLLFLNFEEVGKPSIVTEDVVGSDFDASYFGTEACYMHGSTGAGWRADFTNSDSILVKFRFRVLQLPDVDGWVFRLAENGSTSYLYEFILRTTGTLRINHGTANAITVNALSVATDYYVWVRITKGTGADGIASVAFNTVDSEPTSGNSWKNTLVGTRTTQMGRVRVSASNTATDIAYAIEDLRITVP